MVRLRAGEVMDGALYLSGGGSELGPVINQSMEIQSMVYLWDVRDAIAFL